MSDYYAATKDIAILYSKTGLNPRHYGAFIVGYLNPNDSIVYKNPSFSSLDYGAYELGKLAAQDRERSIELSKEFKSPEFQPLSRALEEKNYAYAQAVVNKILMREDLSPAEREEALKIDSQLKELNQR